MRKKLPLILLLLTFFNLLYANSLDKISQELDEIEREFWSITTLERLGERYRNFSRKMALFTISCRTFQNKLQRNSANSGLPNLTTYSIPIQDILAEVRQKDIQAYGFLSNPRYTSVQIFQGRYPRRIRYKRLKNRNYNQNNHSNSCTENNNDETKVDLDAYENWLYKVKQDNEEDFLDLSKRIRFHNNPRHYPNYRKRTRTRTITRTRKAISNSRIQSLIDYYNLYMTNLIKLRYSIEVIRQKVKNIDEL